MSSQSLSAAKRIGVLNTNNLLLTLITVFFANAVVKFTAGEPALFVL